MSDPNDFTREDLVAYLDGELPEQESQAIEESLGKNEALRSEVDSLSKTWQMLDELVPVRASEEFSAKTLASLATVKNEEPTRRRIDWRELVAPCTGISLVALSAVLMFLLTNRPLSSTAAEELRLEATAVEDFELIKSLHVYQAIRADNNDDATSDVEFVRELHANGAFK